VPAAFDSVQGKGNSKGTHTHNKQQKAQQQQQQENMKQFTSPLHQLEAAVKKTTEAFHCVCVCVKKE